MAWLSGRQQRWGHSPAGFKALGGADKVKEWDQATDFSNLPEKKAPVKKNTMGITRVKRNGQVGK